MIILKISMVYLMNEVAYLDYKKKEVGIKGVIYNVQDYESVLRKINILYKDVSGKRPEQFVLQSIA